MAAPQEKLEKENNISVGVIILSRYSSSRLPGKALMQIDGKPILQYIIERVEQVVERSNIMLATSSDPADDPIVDFAQENAIACFRGSLQNVAERFYQAGACAGWDFAVRINGDNIFVDTNLLQIMIDKARTNKYHFLSNVKNRTFPKGMSIEIVRLAHYQELLPNITGNDYYKEHVTIYMYEHELSGLYYFFYNSDLPELAGLQLALDTGEDFKRTEKIIHQFDRPHYFYNIKELAQFF